jgi:hypothetical protein
MKNSKTVSIRTTIVVSSQNCKVFISQEHFHSFVSIDDYPMSEAGNKGLKKCLKNRLKNDRCYKKKFILKNSVGD